MARYALRNQQKISSVLGADFLEKLLQSADYHFANNSRINAEKLLQHSKEYDVVKISEKGGDRVFIFCIISKRFDVYTLAFKEEVK